jgi:hypothetical protein
MYLGKRLKSYLTGWIWFSNSGSEGIRNHFCSSRHLNSRMGGYALAPSWLVLYPVKWIFHNHCADSNITLSIACRCQLQSQLFNRAGGIMLHEDRFDTGPVNGGVNFFHLPR